MSGMNGSQEVSFGRFVVWGVWCIARCEDQWCMENPRMNEKNMYD